MPLDPLIPANNSPISSAELRAQFAAVQFDLDGLQGEFDATAMGTNGVAPLSLTISNPPTQAEVQALHDKINEILAATFH